MSAASLPQRFATVAELEDCLSEPTAEVAADLAKVPGDILVLGVAGKMGPTLARMAKRAAPEKRIVGVARFSDRGVRAGLEKAGVETVACDLLDRRAVEALPRLANVVFMAGHEVRRVGQSGADLGHERACPGDRRGSLRRLAHRRLLDGVRLPVRACRRRRRHRGHAGRPPPGEYAYSCVGRERMFEHFSARLRHARPHHPAQLCHRHALRRAARHRHQGAGRASRSTSPWATSTSSGRATPTPWRCAAWRTPPRLRRRSTSRGRRR